MTAASMSSLRGTSRRPALGRISRAVRPSQALPVQASASIVQRVNPLPALLALAGVILPTEAQIYVGGARLSPGRIAVVLLLLPALFTLCRKGRRALLCDFLACATVGWIVIATVDIVGWSGLSAAAGGEILEFLGGYLIARAFFLNPSSLDTFIRVLRAFVVIAIIFGMADHISGRYIVHDTVGSLFHVRMK